MVMEIFEHWHAPSPSGGSAKAGLSATGALVKSLATLDGAAADDDLVCA